MAPEIWIIRHGETAWSRTGQHTGRTDIPLTADGAAQAAGLRQRLAGRRFALVLSSPLARARETCRLAGFAEVAQPRDDLMEWDYGAYEGRTTPEIRAEAPGWSLWKDGVPGGEAPADVAARARRVLDEVAGAGGDAALFAHGHVLRVVTACWLGLAPEHGCLFALETAAVGVLGHEGATRVLRKWNL